MAKPKEVLGRVIHKVLQADHPDVTDRELLRRFVEDGDQDAFTAIVRRHSGMVLGVCRRMLATVQDAEDACQATFLVLAQKARSGRWQPSLANWLYTTARHLARNARIAAQRRARRENQANSGKQPLDCMTGRELLDSLDEELERLPPSYREPLVLCYLEGLSRDEAAVRLSIPSATVKTRLERGRKRLGDALVKRGVVAGSGLLVLAASSSASAGLPTASASSRLIEAILATACGTPPAAVAALAKGVAMNSIIHKSTLAALITIGSLALWFGLGSARPQQAGANPAGPEVKAAQPEEIAQKKAPTEPKITEGFKVSGRVVSHDDRPLSNVKLLVPLLLKAEPVRESDVGVRQVGTTDAQGRFEVTLSPSFPRIYLIAHHKGYGIDWLEFTDRQATSPQKEQVLRLCKDTPISGRVVNTEGKPLEGVKVAPVAILVPPNDKLDDMLARFDKGFQDALSTPTKRIYLPLEHILGTTTTDREGRFTVEGLGAERLVSVLVTGKDIARSAPYIVTRKGFDPKPYNETILKKDFDFRSLNRFAGLYAPGLTFIAEPARVIEGVVVDGKTKKPVAGCSVMTSASWGDGVMAVTDAQGTYKLEGVPKNPRGHFVSIQPPRDSAYISAMRQADDAPGYAPIRLDVELLQGAVVVGRVIDRQTGEGVETGIRFAPMADNKFFDQPGFDSYRRDRTMRSTDKDGRFRLQSIPGKVLIMAQVHEGETFHGEHLNPYRNAEPDPDHKDLFTYDKDDDEWRITTAGGSLEFLRIENAVKVIDVKQGEETKIDLYVDRGKTATLEIQDAVGKPLKGAWVAGMTAHWPITYKVPESSTTVYALAPDKPRSLAVWHPETNLGGTATIGPDDKGTVTIRLQPMGSIRGRLLDLEGNPLSGAEVTVNCRADAGSELYRFAQPKGAVTQTDAEGRFTLTDVVPGVEFYVQIRKDKQYFRGEPKLGLHQVKSGQTLDLGDRKVEPIPR